MKLKTRKSILKRIKVTKKKKFLCRPSGQDHFNIKESGRKTRQKRKTKKSPGFSKKFIRKQLPYI